MVDWTGASKAKDKPQQERPAEPDEEVFILSGWIVVRMILCADDADYQSRYVRCYDLKMDPEQGCRRS
jgi:hypothetical protein